MNLAFLYLQKWERELEIRERARPSGAARHGARHTVRGKRVARSGVERQPLRESPWCRDERMIPVEPR